MALFRSRALLDEVHLNTLFPEGGAHPDYRALTAAVSAVKDAEVPLSPAIMERAGRIMNDMGDMEDLDEDTPLVVLALDERQWFLHMLKHIVKSRGLIVSESWSLLRPDPANPECLQRVAGLEITAAALGYDARQPPPDTRNWFVEDAGAMVKDPGLVPTQLVRAAVLPDGFWAEGSIVSMDVVSFGGTWVNVTTGKAVEVVEGGFPRARLEALSGPIVTEEERRALYTKARSMLRHALGSSGIRTRDIETLLLHIGYLMQTVSGRSGVHYRRGLGFHIVPGSMVADLLETSMAFPGINFARDLTMGTLDHTHCGPVLYREDNVDLALISKNHTFVYLMEEEPKRFSGDILSVLNVSLPLSSRSRSLILYAGCLAFHTHLLKKTSPSSHK